MRMTPPKLLGDIDNWASQGQPPDLLAVFVWRYQSRSTPRQQPSSKTVQVLLRRVNGRGWWLPYVPLSVSSTTSNNNNDSLAPGKEVERLAANLAEQIGISGHLRQIRQIRHFCSPKNDDHRAQSTAAKATVVVYDFEFAAASTASSQTFATDQVGSDCRWMTVADMQQLEMLTPPGEKSEQDNVLIDDVPLAFAEQMAVPIGGGTVDEKWPILNLIRAPQNLHELLLLHQRRQSRNAFDWNEAKPAQLAKFTSQAMLEKIFGDFLSRCWPSTEMTLGEFQAQFPVDSSNFWQAFNISVSSKRLNFFDYINGLAMVQNVNVTSPELVDIKLRMLFRFFAITNLSAMNQNEVDAMIARLTAKGEAKRNVLMVINGELNFEAFERLVREHYLADLQAFAFTQAEISSQDDDSDKPAPVRSLDHPIISSNGRYSPFEEVKQICLKSKYFRSKLNIAERNKFIEMFEAISKEPQTEKSSQKIVATVIKSMKPQTTTANGIKAPPSFTLNRQIVTLRRTSHQLSLEHTPIESISNTSKLTNGNTNNSSPTSMQLGKEILNLLNDYLTEERCASGKAASVSLFAFVFKWKTQQAHAQFLQTLGRLVDAVEPLFEAERRLLRLESPCYVAGDIHGNYHDLQTLAHLLWRHGPSMCPAKLLFLGDYVDRGPNALEVVAYLLAQKLMAPDRVFLIRGNHDDPRINVDFLSSCNEACIAAFGEYNNDTSKMLWTQVNRLFSCLPLAALIDGAIFCAHSGIVSSRSGTFTDLDDINSIPPRLESVYDNDIALELCCNDPILPEHVKLQEVQADLNERNDGFTVNIQRSTMQQREKRILYFTKNAFNSFMTANKLQYFVRAQESYRRGCVDKETKIMLTVSCSEPTFNATVLQVDTAGRLQIIRIYTQLMIRDLKNDTSATLFEPPPNMLLLTKPARVDTTKVFHHRVGNSQASKGNNPYLPPISSMEDSSLKLDKQTTNLKASSKPLVVELGNRRNSNYFISSSSNNNNNNYSTGRLLDEEK